MRLCFVWKCHKTGRLRKSDHCYGLLEKDIDHWGRTSTLCVRVCVCVCVCVRQLQTGLCIWPAASDSVSVEWVLESHGYLSAGWRRKHNPEEEGCRYQSVHVGLREQSARLALHISNSPSFCLPISPFSLYLFFALHSDQPRPVSLHGKFRIALQCLRWLLCCKHTKVWHDHGSLFLYFLTCSLAYLSG